MRCDFCDVDSCDESGTKVTIIGKHGERICQDCVLWATGEIFKSAQSGKIYFNKGKDGSTAGLYQDGAVNEKTIKR
ncbi:hypothetical protein DF211_19455 [Pectobacterium parmentieri]|nr:hypothetical protein DF211_19455 [Pectobacterium parmentieri]